MIDCVVTLTREEVRCTTTRAGFLEDNMGLLSLFLAEDDLQESMALARGEKMFQFETIQRVLETRVGSTLFADEGAKVSWLKYISVGRQQLKDAIHSDLSEGAVDDMTLLMKRASGQMIQNGYARFDTKDLEVSWCGWDWTKKIRDIDDQWRLPLFLTALSSALIKGEAQPFPWESDFMRRNGGVMPKYPETLQNPDLRCIASHLKARKHALRLLSESKLVTYGDMVALLEKHLENLERDDVKFEFHLDFAKSQLPLLCMKEGEKDVLKLLPREENQYGPKLENKEAIMASLVAVQRQGFLQRAPLAYDRVATSIVLVKKVFDAQPPTARELASYSEFSLQVLAATANFLTVDGILVGAKCADMRQLRGKEAALFWQEQLMDGEGPPKFELERLEEVRRFMWMLTADAQMRLNSAVLEAAKRKRESMFAELAIEDAKGPSIKRQKSDESRSKVKGGGKGSKKGKKSHVGGADMVQIGGSSGSVDEPPSAVLVASEEATPAQSGIFGGPPKKDIMSLFMKKRA